MNYKVTSMNSNSGYYNYSQLTVHNENELSIVMNGIQNVDCQMGHLLIQNVTSESLKETNDIVFDVFRDDIEIVNADNIESGDTMLRFLSSMSLKKVILINNIDNLNSKATETLLKAINEFQVPVSGKTEYGVESIDIHPFFLIGTSTDSFKISSNINECFANIIILEYNKSHIPQASEPETFLSKVTTRLLSLFKSSQPSVDSENKARVERLDSLLFPQSRPSDSIRAREKYSSGNYSEAFQIAKSAVLKRDFGCCMVLSECYKNGKGTSKDESKSLRLLKVGVNNNSSECITELAKRYDEDNSSLSLEKDRQYLLRLASYYKDSFTQITERQFIKKAITLYKQLSLNDIDRVNCAIIMSRLAIFYADMFDDDFGFLDVLEQTAEQGNKTSMESLAMYHVFVKDTISISHIDIAYKWSYEVAKTGSGIGMFCLAMCEATKRNFDFEKWMHRACPLLIQASNEGSIPASYILGWYYITFNKMGNYRLNKY